MAKKAEFMDYYFLFDMNREMSNEDIKTHLKKLIGVWSARANNPDCPDAAVTLKNLEEAQKVFSRKNKRAAYDEEWDKRKQNGQLNNKDTQEAVAAIERAIKYYNDGNYKLAEKEARNAIGLDPDDIRGYDCLSETLFELGNYSEALRTVEGAMNRFSDNDIKNTLYEKVARFNYIGTKNYDASQGAINKMIEMGNYEGYVKQALLNMFMGKENLAYEEIDKYISSNAESTVYRREVAYGLFGYSRMNVYEEDPKTKNAFVIASGNNAALNLRLAEKAYGIFQDDVTQEWLNDARIHVKKIFNSENLGGIVLYWILAIFAIAMGVTMSVTDALVGGIIVAAVSLFLTIGSFEPYWTIERRALNGKRGFVGTICDLLIRYIKWSVKFAFKMLEWSFKLAMPK